MSYSYLIFPAPFFAYILVVSTLECPIKSHNVGSGIPLFNARVANVCLSKCGNTRLPSPVLFSNLPDNVLQGVLL
ncbi:hypothetical protein HMPREF9469_02859 [ [[Clostridium] citroniae WAL-17108]|uniref:Uncharacterized protein n=1 Tax=[Clostridium] citroniae WAL-17108 TaxID=742733 RepID=G5HJU7_9FIRM|nr:hypothetical protein HMPREF9469_02859 [ [[Clostridium] citroniae WAL-17108]